jgi:hypothetical protein
MFGLFKKKKEPGFWAWLAENTERIHSRLPKEPSVIGAEIGRHFKESYPELTWEVSPTPNPPWVFCISADGRQELFPKVEEAVKAAPAALPGWKIQAFRPRGALTAEIDMGGQTLGYDDIWCEVSRSGGGATITLRIRGLTPESTRALGGAALILLDNAVGEYDAVTKIHGLDCGPLPPDPQRSERFFPLRELPAFLDGAAQ